MLNMETARRIGINACIDKLGREFVLLHRDTATSAYGETENGVFCFVGVDTNYVSQNNNEVLVLDGNTQCQYRVSCNVNPQTGEVQFIECVLPEVVSI